MKQKLFWMSILVSNSVADDCSFSPWSCLPEGNNLLESHHNVSTAEECHQLCRNQSSCTHFTHYNSQVAASLAETCLLLSSCSSKNTNCHGCKSGTRECNPTCNLPKSTGGLWFCSQNNTIAVGSEECFFTCGTRMVVATCLSDNKWDVDLNSRQFECPCSNPPASAATLTCTSEPSLVGPSYPGGTVCRQTCGDELFKTQCFNGDWTDDLSEVCSVSIWFIVGLACVAGFTLLTLVATVVVLSRHRTSRRRKSPDPAVFLDQLPPGRRQEEEEPSRSTRSSEAEEVSRAQERRGWTEQQREFPRYPVSRHLYQAERRQKGGGQQRLGRGASLDDMHI